MKVLVIGPDLGDIGGVANYYSSVLPHLPDSSILVEYLQIGSTHNEKSSSKLYLLYDQIAVWKAITRFQPDIFHVNPSLDFKSYLRDGIFIFQAKLRCKLVLVFFRGWQPEFAKKINSGFFKLFFNITYAKADRFIILAEQFAESLRRWGITVPISHGTTTVAYELLIDFDFVKKQEELAITEELRLLYMARLEPEKGVLVLLESVMQLLNRGYNISLTVAGDGPAMKTVREFVDNMQDHSGKIFIVGYVRKKQKAAMLSSHHIFCFPTRYGEGMPNAVLEAMAFAMPVITTPIGGVADFFRDKEMGLLLEKIDAETLCKSISQIVSDRSALVRMSKFNYYYAQEHFLSSICANFLREQYKQLYKG